MDLAFTILLIIAILLFLFLLLPMLSRGRAGEKPQSAGKAQPARDVPLGPEPAVAVYGQLDSQGFAAPPKIEYSSIEAIIAPRKLAEADEASMQAIRKLLARTAPLPAASIKLEAMLRDPQASARDVATLVSTNPIMSSRILRTVNSPFFGLAAKITSVGRAITLLGFNNVRSIAMQYALRAALPKTKKQDRKDADALWLHSTVVSAASLFLSKYILPYGEHDMGTIGLFHDIGKYFFAALDEAAAPQVELPTLTLSEGPGIDHALLGSLVAGHWRMAEEVVKCIEYHHYPHFFPLAAIPERFVKPALIVCLANLLCKALGYSGPDRELLPIREEYYHQFSLPTDLNVLLTNSALIREIEKARATVESYLEN